MLPTLVIAALVIVGFFVFVGARPDSFRLERGISINAVPEKVFALINDFHESSQWSPWDKIDPALKRTCSGPASGVGTIYEWSGNNKVGSGRMEITGAAPNAKLAARSARSAGATCLICSATTRWRCGSAWALRRAWRSYCQDLPRWGGGKPVVADPA